MKRISRIAPVGVAVLALAVGGSTLASAKGHHGHARANRADVVKDVKDTSRDTADAAKDQASAQSDVTTPDTPVDAQKEQVDAQNEQADNQSEAQDSQNEGDDPGQAAACKGLLTDAVEFDDQTGTCTPESSPPTGATGTVQGDGSTGSGKDTGSTGGGQGGSQND
jgi:hypothetical protein